MGIVDGEDAGRSDDADVETVDGARPSHRQRPGDVEVIDRSVAEHDHASGRIDAAIERAEHLVD